jgi:hypothetical protein
VRLICPFVARASSIAGERFHKTLLKVYQRKMRQTRGHSKG